MVCSPAVSTTFAQDLNTPMVFKVVSRSLAPFCAGAGAGATARHRQEASSTRPQPNRNMMISLVGRGRRAASKSTPAAARASRNNSGRGMFRLTGVLVFAPKGLRDIAQGCRVPAATLGIAAPQANQPRRGCVLRGLRNPVGVGE